MKLVQLLAKELKEWPEGAKYARQDFDGEICFVGGGIWSDFYASCVASDIYLEDGIGASQITEDQWQDEREKMNKPKWIRHRGGWMPVGAATIVEVRLRCGDIQKHEACEFLWRHKDCDSAARIMAYRIIEETKDQEIEEVKKTNFGTITYKLEIDATESTQRIDSLVAKWGHIVSPLKWRDAIIHCQAIIEDCEREIDRNVNLLDAEGLMMQKYSKKAMQHYQTDIDMSDWRNWENGDIIEVIKESETSNAKAGLYTITGFDSDHPKIELDERYFPEYANMKFVRRP